MCTHLAIRDDLEYMNTLFSLVRVRETAGFGVSNIGKRICAVRRGKLSSIAHPMGGWVWPGSSYSSVYVYLTLIKNNGQELILGSLALLCIHTTYSSPIFTITIKTCHEIIGFACQILTLISVLYESTPVRGGSILQTSRTNNLNHGKGG